MQENPTALEGILDIEPPAMPLLYILESNALDILLISLILISLLLAATLLLWRRYFSVKGKALRRFEELQKHFNERLNEKQLDSHHVAFQLSSILRDGLNLKQLSNLTPLPDKLSSHKDNWVTFIEHMSAARYSPSGYTPEQVAMLFKDAEAWLKCWPVSKND